MKGKSNVIVLTQHRPQADAPPLAGQFNKRSHDASEVELKFLVKNNDYKAFQRIKKYFGAQGMVAHSDTIKLLTRQLDTCDAALLRHEETLRIRGREARGGKEVDHPDICLKTGKTIDKSGAVRRGEYESRIGSFDKINIGALKKAYSRKKYPELYEALKHVRQSDLRECFRIECKRSRFLVVLDETQTGLIGKQFVAELVLDQNDFVAMIQIPGKKEPQAFRFYSDLEIEFENHSEPCEYNDHDGTRHIVSSPMTEEEADRARLVMKKHLHQAAQGMLVENHVSKCERGFNAFSDFTGRLSDFIALNREIQARSVASLFRLNAGHDRLPALARAASAYRRSAPQQHTLAMKK